ncbi:MAG: adenine phosphoribosyltransferase [Verrucomicrobia bacterium]|nr:adenine phosphoribosyltransferase [Verrucomicrobiota bacterium]
MLKQTLIGLAAWTHLFGASGTAECTWIKNYIVPVPHFPRDDIIFQCYTDILLDPVAFQRIIQAFAERYRDQEIDVIAGLDARGFIFGGALAYELKKPFVMVRKPDKLPRKSERIDYELQYGKNSFEIEVGLLKEGDRVLIIDDVLATGGSARAASDLIKRFGAEVIEIACLLELKALNGRAAVGAPVYSLLALEAQVMQ